MKKFRTSVAITTLATLAAISLLSGCGGNDEKKAPSQVVARVNGKEITVHQLNLLLQGQPNATDDVKQKALESLIDQEILVQKAEELKLDRDPNVLQIIEQTRRDVLARSALQRLGGAPGEVSDKEVDDYIAQHPEMFAERKIFKLARFVMDGAAFNDALRGQLDASKTSADTEQVLKAAGVRYALQETRVPTEQLPPALLGTLPKRPLGDIILQSEGGRMVLWQASDAVSEPLDKGKAGEAVRQFLQAKHRNDALGGSVKSLRQAAKVEYVQKFDKASAPAASAAAAAPVQPAAAPSASNNSALSEGMKGLK